MEAGYGEAVGRTLLDMLENEIESARHVAAIRPAGGCAAGAKQRFSRDGSVGDIIAV
jgi:hypothetical protein